MNKGEKGKVRKALSCVLMMTLLLAGCGAGEDRTSPEKLAAQIRGEYLNLVRWTAVAELRADYGERVYDFTVEAAWEKDGETVLRIVKPELVAGITARIGKDGTCLEYDGMSLSTGALDGNGLVPLEALPFIMDQLTAGYMAECAFVTEGEQRLLKISCRDPEAPEGSGTECAVYFDPDSHDLLRAELSWEGFTVLTVRLKDFTKEMNADESRDGPHVG